MRISACASRTIPTTLRIAASQWSFSIWTNRNRRRSPKRRIPLRRLRRSDRLLGGDYVIGALYRRREARPRRDLDLALARTRHRANHHGNGAGRVGRRKLRFLHFQFLSAHEKLRADPWRLLVRLVR